ncbi:gamma-glutamylcyclotransferase family protein [Pseudoalteromonas sp. McH1-42]|uniref:gamma-glutamylcyclotransferase family protein n=1 Tax=Pseudoalteromonas sp. McH1-42 TaxID=2917752 RepID=UPI001EF700C9|nr:gamma-glutamylcyclotransferase family protein [Pseudoalteromonas sp. McH1-42]MCG7561626.1 gamma-glutamylcyclotransferase [Pseudoalteromonas sp. McH1-42]
MVRLFVYGTLAPGRPNEHILAGLNGQWQPGFVNGHLQNQGWGAELGYPGLTLDTSAEEVSGLVFSSPELDSHWQRLDEFEGEHYKRVIAQVRLDDGETIPAYVYTLA